METELSISEVRENLSEIVDQVQSGGNTYIITRRGKPAAAVVSIEVYENWKQQRKTFVEAVRRIQSTNGEADPGQVMEDVLKAQQVIRSSG